MSQLTVREQIKTITLSNIKEFLLREKWNDKERVDNGKFIVYRAPLSLSSCQRVTLPASLPDDVQKTEEFQKFVYEVLDNLAYIYDCQISDILKRIGSARSPVKSSSYDSQKIN